MTIVTLIARLEASTVKTYQRAITHLYSSPLAKQCHHSDLIELHCPSKCGFKFLSSVHGYAAVHKEEESNNVILCSECVISKVNHMDGDEKTP